MTAQQTVQAFLRTNPRHPEDAYKFLYEVVDWIASNIFQNEGKIRHITGAELSLGFRDYAIEQFGCMAYIVLEFWGIHSTENIGNMVFDLINLGILGSSVGDQKSDFDSVFDFKDAFSVQLIFDSYDPETDEWEIHYAKIKTPPK